MKVFCDLVRNSKKGPAHNYIMLGTVESNVNVKTVK